MALLTKAQNDTRKLENARITLRSLADPNKVSSVSDIQRLEAVQTLIESGKLRTFVPLLPMCLNLNGHPFTLDDHFPLEPTFNRILPDSLTVKGGRQFGKSTFQAARSLILSTTIPYFNTLFVFPLYEQVSRFSSQYVGKFIKESPISSSWVGTGTNNSVLTKSFKNFSQMTFSFAGLSAERIRGIATNQIIYDECQNLDRNLIPVINEALSHSLITNTRTGKRHHAKLTVFTGTPKTMENLLEKQWQQSSMAEWVIPCRVCKKANYPSKGMDLERMIGPVHPDIGEVHEGKRPGTICASSKCGLSINPRDGFWHHRRPDRILTNPGYHIPQIIIPIHYAHQKGWASLLGKQHGAQNYTLGKFYNEVLGESYDTGAKLISETDLKKAGCLPWNNDPLNPAEIARRVQNRYICKFLGVDWGGGGEEEQSFTTAAVVGMLPDGRLEVPYGRRLLLAHDAMAEAEILLHIFNMFQCDAFCHDYNGAGALREQYMIQAGLPYEKAVPMVYYRSGAKDIVVFHKATEEHHRSYYHLDKARSIQLVCETLKMKHMITFRYDYKDADERGLLNDFTSLVSVSIETARAGEFYSVHRNPSLPDDFAHSVTFAACGIWHQQQSYPNLSLIANLRLTDAQQQAYSPSNPWFDQV